MPGGINPPIEVKLSWPTPNYVNPTLRPNAVLWIACVLGPITVVMTLVRLWVRIFHQRCPGWDDWLMLAALPPVIALTVIYPLATNQAFDRHIWDLNYLFEPEIIVNARKYVLATECVFCVATGLVKVSILLFYRRLSARAVSNTFVWVTWATIGFIIAYTIALTLAPILGCQPISAFWDQVNIIKKLQGYEFHCFDEGADVFAASIISCAQDALTAVLPTFLYWNLQIPIRQKLALFGIFAMGYGVVALGAVRAYYSWYTFYGTYDVTWHTWNLFLTCMLELYIGCLCANAPAMKVFFKHFFQEKLSQRSKTRTPAGTDDRQDSAHTKSKNSWRKFGASITGGSWANSTKGYYDSHLGTTVDPHGGVHVHKEVQVTMSPTSSAMPTPTGIDRPVSTMTADMICDRDYEDIELGRYTTGHNSRASSMRSTHLFEGHDLEALPPLPMSPASPTSPASVAPLASHPLSPTEKRLPITPLPGTAISQESRRERSPTPMPPPPTARESPYPPRGSSQKKPSWQSWS
ncbi:uncharacterized protein J4E78_009182 [Alternaria triticimaculans]|uniref:uncharacterized protein n=1 Tax=Alternaria triticimaculans TaxID=297637 RepID=UPI0020C22B49|nr:uncharacterized protein J4E78_009182 [Alternaria triticimaculans]KAI4646261.1 hypothetical protein J4E78_009182 [Alternaria triticimaculans]